jgi:tripartite-type tricarboxylate transporter receptor subunit TctC
MSASAEWTDMLKRNGLTPFFLGGKEFETFVTNQTAAYRNVSKDIGIVP